MCGLSSDDYNTPSSGHQGNSQPPSPGKERRQAAATRAAWNYGWPSPYDPRNQYSHRRMDSYIEPRAARAITGLPGHGYYDHQASQPPVRFPFIGPPPYPRESSDRPVLNSPLNITPRSHISVPKTAADHPRWFAHMPPISNVGQTPNIIHQRPHQRPPPARKPVIQTASSGITTSRPPPAHLAKRDGSRASRSSSADVHHANLGSYAASPRIPTRTSQGERVDFYPGIRRNHRYHIGYGGQQPQNIHEHSTSALEPVVQAAPYKTTPREPPPVPLIRKDSNGVSELSDDEEVRVALTECLKSTRYRVSYESVNVSTMTTGVPKELSR